MHRILSEDQSNPEIFGTGESLPLRDPEGIESFLARDENTILRARQITAESYLKRGYITTDEIDEHGVISETIDPYIESSDYFVVVDDNREVIATTRKIRFNPVDEDESFPVWKYKDEFDQDLVDDVLSNGLENCVEISALAKVPGSDKDGMAALKLYRSLFQDAIKRNSNNIDQEVFLMALRPSLYNQFKIFFDGSITRLGGDIDYPGEKVVPAYIKTREGMVNLINVAGDPENEQADIHGGVVEFLLDGANPEDVSEDIIDALENNDMEHIAEKLIETKPVEEEIETEDIEQEESLTITEKMRSRKPELLAMLALLGYTAARTAGVRYGISPHSDVDWRIFLGIEAATTPAYVLGVGDMVRSIKNPENYTSARLAKSAAFAGSALLAPYAYLVAQGEGMPSGAWAAVGGVFAIGATSFGMKLHRAKNALAQD